mgnify:CR=1 FL=1
MGKRSGHARLFFYSLLVVLYFFTIFLPSRAVRTVFGLVGVICILLSFPGADRLYRMIGFLFFTAGIGIAWVEGISLKNVPDHFVSPVMMLALLFVLPFFQSLMRVGAFDRTLNRLLSVRVGHLGKLYIRGTFVSYLLTVFLFFAAIPIAHDLLKRNLAGISSSLQKKFLSRAILRGFALGTVWSPLEVLIALVAEMTRVDYTAMLPWLLLFSLTLLLADGALGYRYRAAEWDGCDRQPAGDDRGRRRLFLLPAVLAFFMGFVWLVQSLLQVRFFTAVTLAMVPYAAAWAAMLGRLKRYVKHSCSNWKRQTPQLQNMVLLFLSVGFFNGMIQQSAAMEGLQSLLHRVESTPLLLFLTIQLFMLGMTFLGISTLVTLSLVGVFIQPLLESIHPLSLALVLVTSSVAPDVAGPYNSTVILMSERTGVNPYRISRWNLGFSLAFGGAGVGLACLLL